MGERELVAAAAIGSCLGARSGHQEPLQVREIVLPSEEAQACPAPAPPCECQLDKCPAVQEPVQRAAPQGPLQQYLFDLALSDSYELEGLLVAKAAVTLFVGWATRRLCCVSRRQNGHRRVGRIRYPSPRHR